VAAGDDKLLPAGKQFNNPLPTFKANNAFTMLSTFNGDCKSNPGGAGTGTRWQHTQQLR
jgi:hypothetical protein